jgi:hypothetical protein
VTGEIAVCRGNRLSLYTLNGALLLEQTVCDSTGDKTLACVFYEGVGDEWQERDLLFTGHRRGVVNVSLAKACCSLLIALLTFVDLEQDHAQWPIRVGVDSATPSR